MMGQAVVCVVDDDAGFRAQLTWKLRARGYAVRAYASPAEVLLDPERQPGCFILEFTMPAPGGLALQDALTNWPEPPPVLFLSARADVASAVRAMRGGALDVLLKPVADAELFAAVERALTVDAEGRTWRRRARWLRARFESLSARERAVFAQVVRGCINRDIAHGLHIAERTVKAHRARVMQVMEAPSLPDLVRIGAELGLAIGRAEPGAFLFNRDVQYFPAARFSRTRA